MLDYIITKSSSPDIIIHSGLSCTFHHTLAVSVSSAAFLFPLNLTQIYIYLQTVEFPFFLPSHTFPIWPCLFYIYKLKHLATPDSAPPAVVDFGGVLLLFLAI